MRCARLLLIAFVVSLSLVFVQGRSANAAFHFAVIDEVMTSYGGNTQIQFVEIRMLGPSQNFITDSVLGAFAADGSHLGDVLVVPSDVTNSGTGVRWLMGTTAFQTASGLTPDFAGIPASLPTGGGMVCWGAPGLTVPPPASWDHANPDKYVDCVAYGNYSGPSNIHIGTPTPLDADGHSLQRVANTNDSANDFICGDLASPTSNTGAFALLAATTICDADGDGVSDSSDLCANTPQAASIDANGCSQLQVDQDLDQVCDAGESSPLWCSGTDNCPTVANGPNEAGDPGVGDQTNTDVFLAGAGATIAVGVPILSDTSGDACDDEDDNESGSATQDPGLGAGTCPAGVLPVWSDCVEVYLGTVIDDNCTGPPGPGGDALPPDTNVDGKVNNLDAGKMAPFWRQTVQPPPTVDAGRRYDLNVDGNVNNVDVGKMAPYWREDCS